MCLLLSFFFTHTLHTKNHCSTHFLQMDKTTPIEMDVGGGEEMDVEKGGSGGEEGQGSDDQT